MDRSLLKPGENTVPITLRGAWWAKWSVHCEEHGWQSQRYWLASTVVEIARAHVYHRHQEEAPR